MEKAVRILLVEDNPADARLIRETLAGAPDFPFSLEQASELSTGMGQLAAQDPDVILLDLMLPDSHGLDTFAKTQAQAPQKPIIVLSGLDDQDLADKAVREGAQDYLVKGQMDGNLLVRAIHYAIERKQSEAALRRRTRELELLNRAGQTLSSTLDLDQVLAAVLEEVRHLLGVMAASIWLIDPETGELVCRQATGPQNEIVRGWRLAPGEGLVGWVVRNGKSLIVPDVQADERHSKRVDQETGLALRSALSIPLKTKQKVIGVLQVVDAEIARFDTDDLGLLEPLAAAAAIAIENAQLYAETEKLRAFNENIVQSLEEGILLEDVAGQITFVNRKAAELLGYVPEELTGRHWADIVAPGHQADIEAGGASPAEGIVIRYETVLLAQDGRLIPAIVSARWLYEEGRLAGVLSAFTDISARRQAEEALRESEEKYRTLFETSPESITLVSPDGTILDCNDATVEIIGIPREEMIGKPAADLGLLHEEDIPRQLAILSQIAAGEKAGPYELKIRGGKDTRWLEVFPTPLTKTGDLYAIQVIIRDVTKRRWAEEKIRQRNEELTAINAIAAAVSQSLDLQAVLQASLQETMLALNAEGGIVYLFDKDSQSFAPTIHHGLSPQVLQEIGGFKIGEGPSGRAVQSGQPLFVPDIAQDPRNATSTAIQEGWQSLVSVPLESAGKTAGVMTVVSREKDRFGPGRLGMLSAIGNQIGVAIENAQLFEAVHLGRERLQILSQRLVEVQENERRYIARELHDEIGQYLTGLKLVLDMAARSPGEVENDSLEEALALADELMAQVRNLSLDLRPTMLDDLGLLPALLWHCGRYTDQTGVHVDLRHTNLEGQRFKPEVETAAYRIVQEALTNIARHAGVDNATVRLWVEQDVLSAQITDQGAGFNPDDPLISDTSSGLVGMRERAALLGGKLTIKSAPGAGTCLTAKLPLGGTVEQQE
ncbi:MAG: GAF domain-containing protein [Anaerolineae bacterium]|nr:GAF domain-containing protein [Anaerolineae bacterium]